MDKKDLPDTNAFGVNPIAVLGDYPLSLRSLSRFIPGLLSEAPQLDGTPLVPNPNANTITRPLPGTFIIDGAWASKRFRPAPDILIFTFFKVANVSKRPEYPQSSTWLLAREQTSILAAVKLEIFSGCIR